MKTHISRLLLILFSVAIPFVAWSQTNYYVSPTGSNSNSGNSTNSAWQTIQYAMNNATPNSVVHIMGGVYQEKVEVNVSGNAGNPIVFKNYNQQAVTISGSGNPSADAVIGIFDQSYITIQGLHVTDNQQIDAQGIIVEGNCEHIEIRENEISNINFSTNPNAPVNSSTNSQPIIVYGSNAVHPVTNIIIADNLIHDCQMGFSEGLAVNGNVDGFTVINNTLHDLTNIGIDIIGHEGTASSNDQARNGVVKHNLVYNCKSPYATAAGIYVDGGKDVVIENNTVFECQWGIEIGCENVGKTTSGIMVRNNVIYKNDDAALAVGGFDYPSNSGKVVNCAITNNSCYDNDKNSSGTGGVTGEINLSYTENCSFQNNIFYGANSADILLYVDDVSSVNFFSDYNQFYFDGDVEFEYEGTIYTSLSAYQAATGNDAHSLYSNPAWNDPAAADFHLTASAPGRDAGNPAFVPASGETDLDGESRVQNSRVDIGADEYSLTVPVVYVSTLQAVAHPTHVSLHWSAIHDEQHSHYLVQRSTDTRHWTVLQTIMHSKQTEAVQHFHFVDKNPLPGQAYYRLQQIDHDGSTDYSTIAAVQWSVKGSDFNVFPNPATNHFTIELEMPFSERLLLQCFNAEGKLYYHQWHNAPTVRLDISTWQRGLYKVNISNELGNIETTSLLIL